MIHKIYSDLNKFKNLEFKPGLNILLADKSVGATSKQTRNRTGKTTLVEIIHFLLGADCPKDSILKVSPLLESKFGIELDVGETKTTIERSPTEPSKIFVPQENIDARWSVKTIKDKKSGILTISNENWKKVLGEIMFKLYDYKGEAFQQKYKPSFRMLISYFARREREGGFFSPINNSKEQMPWDEQMAITFLLGLDWGIINEWQLIRDKEKTLRELKKAAGSGLLGEIIGSVASLRTQLAVSEEKMRKLKEITANFRVLPQYEEYEKEASSIKRQLAELSNENIIDNSLIAELEKSLVIESPPSIDEVKSIYEEVGIHLPANVFQRFEDVEEFHKSIVNNRKSYLATEIQDAKFRINKREKIKKDLSERKTELMALLNSHGALEELMNLKSQLSKIEVETELIKKRFLAAQELEQKKTHLEIERKRLYSQLQKNYQEQKEIIDKSIVLFESISKSLYEQAGSFNIIESDNGPEFEFPIQGKGSKGIDNMQIFCFDMMVAILCIEKNLGPKFLIHDSHIFDGVDERQISKALEIGAKLSEQHGFQYIVTMNSDDLPKEVPNNFNFHANVLSVRLTDATQEGGLLGVRVDSSIKKSEKESEEELLQEQ